VLGKLGEKETVSHASNEQKLHTISMAIGQFFDRYDDTVCHMGHLILCWLRSQHHGKPYKAPFELPGREATQKRYRGLWKRMVFFCIRAYLVQAQDTNKGILNLLFSADAYTHEGVRMKFRRMARLSEF
jgi:hypothetical protein